MSPRGGVRFNLTHLFPEHNGERKPLDKQQLIFDAIMSGDLQGGGAIYQGGKGSGKTLVGSAVIVAVHHLWPGTTSLIGRETYSSLLTSTADEFMQMVARLPQRLIKSMTKPSKNSMGVVEWEIGGRTMLCSLSNSDVWESANLGVAWVDEAHRQNPTICGDLETRLRQPEGPRFTLYTTNPGGMGWLYHKAHPKGNDARDARARRWGFPWLWVEATTLENPTLPEDYHKRLVRRYGLNTPAYRRWVLGESSALEGAVFTEFDDKPDHCLHVVPVVEIPENWIRGRGMDYGMVNPTCVVWGAFDDDGNLWVDRCHYAPAKPEEREQWTVERHAEVILDIDDFYQPELTPADPSMWAKLHESSEGIRYSTAERFMDMGVVLDQANNDRQSGLQRLLDMVAIDEDKIHPVSLKTGSPSIFVLDRPENEPLIRELMGLEWAKQDGSPEQQRPDDCQKKNDHAYDALRYLAMAYLDHGIDQRNRAGYGEVEQEQAVVGTRGRRRRY